MENLKLTPNPDTLLFFGLLYFKNFICLKNSSTQVAQITWLFICVWYINLKTGDDKNIHKENEMVLENNKIFSVAYSSETNN